MSKSPVVSVTAPDGRASIFVIGGDDAVYVNSQQSTGSFNWSGWKSLGGRMKTLTATRNDLGETLLAGVGMTDTLFVNRQTAPNAVGNFVGFRDVGGAFKQIEVGTNLDGRFQIFGVGMKDNVISIAQSGVGSPTWNGFTDHGGVVNEIALGKDTDGRLRVVAIGANKAVFLSTQATPNENRFVGWGSVGGEVKSIRVDSRAAGRMQIFAVGLDNRVWTLNQTRENSDNWEGWRQVAAALPIGIAALARTIIGDDGTDAQGNDDVSIERIGSDIRILQNGRTRLVNITATSNEIVFDLKGGTNVLNIRSLGINDVVKIVNSATANNLDIIRIGNGRLASVQGRLEIGNRVGFTRIELNDSRETVAAKYLVESYAFFHNGRKLLSYDRPARVVPAASRQSPWLPARRPSVPQASSASKTLRRLTDSG